MQTPHNPKKPRIRLGEMLVKADDITQEQLDDALEEQKTSKAKIGEILVELGYTTEDKIFLHLARQLDIPYMSLSAQRIEAEVLNLVPVEIVTKYNIIPIDKIGKLITIAMSNPLYDEACVEVGKITGLKVQKVASSKKDIAEAIERYYRVSISDTSTEDNQPAEQTDSEVKLEEAEDVLLQEEPEENGSTAPASAELPPAHSESEEQSDFPRSLATGQSDSSQQDMTIAQQTSHIPDTTVTSITTPKKPPPVQRDAPFTQGIRPFTTKSTFAQQGEATIADELFVPAYTFDNFISDGDAEALRAAIHLCNIEQVLYNPLLIFAEKGLGKTHLLHAIGNNITQNAPQKNIEYINCRELSLRMTNADIYEVCSELRRNWRLLDILLFDDFQVLLDEKSNREAFIFIFDFLYHRKKQLVIASRPIDAGDCDIEVSLLSRIEAGLKVTITPPNFETRLAILRKWEEIEGSSRLADTDLNSIAEQTYEDVRQLLAARNRLRFQTLLMQNVTQ